MTVLRPTVVFATAEHIKAQGHLLGASGVLKSDLQDRASLDNKTNSAHCSIEILCDFHLQGGLNPSASCKIKSEQVTLRAR